MEGKLCWRSSRNLETSDCHFIRLFSGSISVRYSYCLGWSLLLDHKPSCHLLAPLVVWLLSEMNWIFVLLFKNFGKKS